MSMEQQYARILWHFMEKGKSLPEALKMLNPVLVRRGHTTIVRKTVHALARLAETRRRTDVSTLFVAREQDAPLATKEIHSFTNNDTPSIKVDPTIIGGWRLESSGVLRDHSYKKALLDMYRTITS